MTQKPQLTQSLGGRVTPCHGEWWGRIAFLSTDNSAIDAGATDLVGSQKNTQNAVQMGTVKKGNER
jgi:hypothetical protein